MKVGLKSKLGLSVVSLFSLVPLLTSCYAPSHLNTLTSEFIPTASRGIINKSTLGFEQTIEKNAFKINKQWILDNKSKLLEGDVSLFTSVDDILEFSAKPLIDDDTKLEIYFKLEIGRAIANNKKPTNLETSYKVIVSNFDMPTRTIETLSELLNNFLNTKVKPKKFIMQADKFIRINERPGYGDKTHSSTKTWLTTNFIETSRGLSFGDSTGKNCTWVPYGWNKGQANASNSDVWNWLENIDLDSWDLYSYINTLLKDYKYFNDSHQLQRIYLYSQLEQELVDDYTNKDIYVYRRKYVPVGWGFRVHENGRENNIINDGIKIPTDGDYIPNSYNQEKEINFEFGYKWQNGGNPGNEETIDFSPNYKTSS